MRNYATEFLKLAKFMYNQRIIGFSVPGNTPFMPDEDVNIFKNEIKKASHYVEFGSGGSTVYASKLDIYAISVENDRFYANVVAKNLHGNKVRQMVINLGITGEWGMPVFPNAKKARAYVNAPWEENSFPQFILVDGRYRVACALESAKRAHLAGTTAMLMLDDYADRPFYHGIEKYLGLPEIRSRAALFRIGNQKIDDSDLEIWLKDPR